MQISVTIISLNGAELLPGCLESIKALTDDVVLVIDDRTTDNSSAIGKKYHARVFSRKFVGFVHQTNPL